MMNAVVAFFLATHTTTHSQMNQRPQFSLEFYLLFHLFVYLLLRRRRRHCVRVGILESERTWQYTTHIEIKW